ncbi:MAG: zinc ABC transporter solute-binding protein [Clostridiaceae bacterium]|nr:zinc ABC transporter solute-binding protein [Clostridiaceae bacterium]
MFKDYFYNRYHKLNLVILALLLISTVFSACSSKQDSNKTDGDDYQTIIVTSFYPMYVFTLNIVADVPDVRVVNMTQNEAGCLHDYHLTTKDLKTLQNADIFVYNGAGMEDFLDKVISQLPDLKLVEASKDIPLIENSDGTINPHVWVSVSGAISQIRNIADGLKETDPVHAEQYEKNALQYIEKLEALKKKMQNELEGIAERDIITFHEAFPYFAQEFGLNIAAVIEDESGSDFSAGELAQIIKEIERTGVKVLFAEPHNAEKAELIAEQTGTKLYFLNPVVSGSEDAAPDSYEKAMLENLQVLKEALN